MDTYRNPTSARRRRHGGAWLAGSLVAGLLVSGTLPSSAGTADATATAAVETTPSDKTGDTVDDMAIWVDPADPTRSVVIGADHGDHSLYVYDLSGARLQHARPLRRQQRRPAHRLLARSGRRSPSSAWPAAAIPGAAP